MQKSVEFNNVWLKMSVSAAGTQSCTLFTVKIFCYVVVRTAPGKEPVRMTTSGVDFQNKTVWRFKT